MSIIYTTYESPLGTLTLYATASALVGLTFPTQSVNFQEPVVIDKTISSPILQQTIQWLDQYFIGQVPTMMILKAQRSNKKYGLSYNIFPTAHPLPMES